MRRDNERENYARKRICVHERRPAYSEEGMQAWSNNPKLLQVTEDSYKVLKVFMNTTILLLKKDYLEPINICHVIHSVPDLPQIEDKICHVVSFSQPLSPE